MPADKDDRNPVSEVVDLVKGYAKQETIGPLKGAGRWLAMGVGGAVCIGIGVVLLVLALLRVLQEETNDTFDGNWSFAPYLITLVVAAIVVAIAVSRIGKTGLDRKEDR
jgi:cell division protein FtsW (lipid II flippase)